MLRNFLNVHIQMYPYVYLSVVLSKSKNQRKLLKIKLLSLTKHEGFGEHYLLLRDIRKRVGIKISISGKEGLFFST